MRKTINQIKEKLDSNKAMISKADKGNSIVIVYQNKYHRKVIDFV
jgi:poly-gamma-glutamate capsule biosynthesis protein CapA/YwtB (metallophosphatase superfamily)